MSAGVIVQKSRIDGKGVFANRVFKKGEVVIDWSFCSETLTKEKVNALSHAKKKFVSYLGNGKFVLFRSPGKFVNHSCQPNTKAMNGCDVAVRNIQKGEEITADYVSEKVPDLNMKCDCNAKNCRKIIRTSL